MLLLRLWSDGWWRWYLAVEAEVTKKRRSLWNIARRGWHHHPRRGNVKPKRRHRDITQRHLLRWWRRRGKRERLRNRRNVRLLALT